MKKTIRLTEEDLRNIILKAVNEANKMNDMVIDFNRYGHRLPSNYYKDNDTDKPSDWDKPTTWKLRNPDVDDSDRYGDTPQSIQKRKDSHLAYRTGHPINYNSGDVCDKISSDEQLNNTEYSSHNFTYDDKNSVFIRPNRFMMYDDDIWKDVNEPTKKKIETFDSADKRPLHRKGSANRELISMDADKKFNEAITRAIRKLMH